MPIPFECECGQRFEAPDAGAGHLARCPVCGREIVVPQPAAPEVFYVGEIPTRTSRLAVASLVVGAMFFFACFSGIPALLMGWFALDNIKRSGGTLRGRKRAIAGIVLGYVGCLVTLLMLMPPYWSAHEAARRSQCVNRLKQIGLALYNYQSECDTLPPAAITSQDGKPLLSWRVAILPFLECKPLYQKFHLDEPWDSPHNLALIKEMPGTYACPSDPNRERGMTNYLVVVGRETAWRSDFQPLRFAEITDGLAQTLLVAESTHTVPWTKPEDLPFDMTVPRSGLGGPHNNGFNALRADGAVKFLRSSIAPATLRAFLTRNGKEILPADLD